MMGAILASVLWWFGYGLWYFIPLLFAILIWQRLGLCEVTLDGQTLRISNYRGEATVPLTAIDSVTERRWGGVAAGRPPLGSKFWHR
jgi:hypothetical protein